VIDFEQQRRARFKRALLHGAEMHDQVARLLLGIGDAESHALAGHQAGIADLAAGFRVNGVWFRTMAPLAPALRLSTSLPSFTSAATTPSAVSVS